MTNNLENKTEKAKEFNFDYWCGLAKDNPEEFEVQRKKEIDAYISGLKDTEVQSRMQRLQWRVEMERKRSKNPLDAAIRIYDMMWESVGKNFEAIQELADIFRPGADKSHCPARPQAKVLKFNREEHTGTNG